MANPICHSTYSFLKFLFNEELFTLLIHYFVFKGNPILCLYIKIKLLTLGPFDGKWFSRVFSFPFVKIYLLTCGFFTSKLNCLNLDESKLFIKFICLTISQKSANELFIERVVSFLLSFSPCPFIIPKGNDRCE